MPNPEVPVSDSQQIREEDREESRKDDVVASLAVTLDGYICRPNGDVDYLEKYPIEDFDFDEWVGRIGSLVMGSASYRQSVDWGWNWAHLPTLVLTSQDDLPVPENADVTFSCLLYTSPSPRDATLSRMPSSA